MIAIITIITLVFIGTLNLLFEKKVYNLLTIFCYFWAIICFLAKLHLYGMVETSYKPYMLTLIGIIGYTCGYYFYKCRLHIHKINEHRSCTKIIIRYDLNKTLYIVMIVAATLYIIYLAIKVTILLRSGIPYSTIREMYGGIEGVAPLLTTKFEYYFCSYFIVPVIFVISIVLFLSLVEHKDSVKLNILAIIDIMLYCYVTGSRVILFSLIVQSIYFLIIYKITLSRKTKKIIKILVTVMIIAIVFITIQRYTINRVSEQGWTLIMNYYAYASVCMPLADHWISIVDVSGLKTYGMATFGGIVAFLNIFLGRLGFAQPALYIYTNKIITCGQDYIKIFPNRTFNAFLTIFYYFYLDFRCIGVFLGCFLFGLICCCFYSKVFSKNRNYLNLFIFMLIIIAICKSMARWEFYQVTYILSFIYSRIILRKKFVKAEKSPLEL